MTTANNSGSTQAAPENHTPSTPEQGAPLSENPIDDATAQFNLDLYTSGLALELAALSNAILCKLTNLVVRDCPEIRGAISHCTMLAGIAERTADDLFRSIDTGEMIGRRGQ